MGQHSYHAHIGEYRGTTEEHILNKIQLWDANSLLLKKYTYFLSSSLKEGMSKQTNISEALLYFGMPNSFVNCYYMLFSSFSMQFLNNHTTI